MKKMENIVSLDFRPKQRRHQRRSFTRSSAVVAALSEHDRPLSTAELRLCAALCGLKIVLMPALYRGAALALGVGSGAVPFLAFIGVLPASASVYSLASTKGLEPRVLGPLVPLTMLLCVALVLLPLSPAAAGVDTALSAAVAVVAAAALALTLRAPAKEKPL